MIHRGDEINVILVSLWFNCRDVIGVPKVDIHCVRVCEEIAAGEERNGRVVSKLQKLK